MKTDYTLYYWPAPFRGHFIRAILSFAGKSWDEPDDLIQQMSAEPDAQLIPFMGPPVLRNNANGFVTSEMPAIAMYLGETLNLLPVSPKDRALALKIICDANDVIDEITLQGGMEMWTQDSWNAYVPRLKRWMKFWESEIERDILFSGKITVAEIVTATLWMTMTERFSAIQRILKEAAPKTFEQSQKLWTRELSAFAQDSWDKYGDSYCGGQIEQALRKVAKK
ncbi:glutathione S-transferase [Lactovum odontotermitis]